MEQKQRFAENERSDHIAQALLGQAALSSSQEWPASEQFLWFLAACA
jgi:hypothetical protein